MTDGERFIFVHQARLALKVREWLKFGQSHLARSLIHEA